MLGGSLLIAPVFSGDGQVSFYVPAGRWTHLLSGGVVEGPRCVRERCDFHTLPVLVRPNTALATGADDSRPDYAYADGVQLSIFEIEDGAQILTHVPAVDGTVAARFTTRRSGSAISVQRTGVAGAWSVRLVGVHGGVLASRGEVSSDAGSTVVSLSASDSQVEMSLA